MDWAASLVGGGVSGSVVGAISWHLLRRANDRADAALSLAQQADMESKQALAELQRLQQSNLITLALCDARRNGCSTQFPQIMAALTSLDTKLDDVRDRVTRLESRP